MSNKTEKNGSLLTRCLNGIERVGNALPHPVTLFAILALVIVVISAICAAMGVSATGNLVSGGELKETTVTAVSLLTKDGLRYIFTSAVNNFTTYAPLGMVLVAMLGVGVAEKSGMIDTLLKNVVKYLGHPHVLSGTVIHGKALGRKLGVPTANLRLPEGLAIPKFGVYACSVIIDGKRYPAVTNIGTRPTVEGSGITVEPWILDYSGDLYGRDTTLEFHYFLRPEKKFPTLDALKEEIYRDAEATRLYLNRLFAV